MDNSGWEVVLFFNLQLLVLETINDLWVEIPVLGFDGEVFECEVAKAIDLILLLCIKEGDAFALAVAHHDVVGIGEGRVLSSLEVVELLPRGNEKEIPYRTGDVLNSDVFVSLRGVWAHL